MDCPFGQLVSLIEKEGVVAMRNSSGSQFLVVHLAVRGFVVEESIVAEYRSRSEPNLAKTHPIQFAEIELQ
jgi:hypothetical protein